jgi:uncharacterized protein YutD
MKMIKVSDAVHKRLVKDKKHFTDAIGINFRFSDTIQEYQKILGNLEPEDVYKKGKNALRRLSK